MEDSDNIEKLTGTILLCEKIFLVLERDVFEQLFSQIANKLRGAADLQIGRFKQDIQTAQSQGLMVAEDPIGVRLMNQLEVLQAWANMFQSLISTFENKKYSNFDVLIRSEDLASVFLQIIALTSNKTSALHQNSVISFSGIAKLDQKLNNVK